MGWKVTVRHSSDVDREGFETLDEALEEVRGRAAAVLSEGGLGDAAGFRTYEPGEQVHARIELTGPGLVRRASGGLDVMGDGSVIPYRGAIRKEPLGASRLDEAIDRLREALA